MVRSVIISNQCYHVVEIGTKSINLDASKFVFT